MPTTTEAAGLRSPLSNLVATVPELSLAPARKLSVTYPSTGHPLVGTGVPALFSLPRPGRPVLLDRTGSQGEEVTACAAATGIGVVAGEQSWTTTASVVVVRPDGHVLGVGSRGRRGSRRGAEGPWPALRIERPSIAEPRRATGTTELGTAGAASP